MLIIYIKTFASKLIQTPYNLEPIPDNHNESKNVRKVWFIAIQQATKIYFIFLEYDIFLDIFSMIFNSFPHFSLTMILNYSNWFKIEDYIKPA